jgi:hypothetical protein
MLLAVLTRGAMRTSRLVGGVRMKKAQYSSRCNVALTGTYVTSLIAAH